MRANESVVGTCNALQNSPDRGGKELAGPGIVWLLNEYGHHRVVLVSANDEELETIYNGVDEDGSRFAFIAWIAGQAKL